VITIGARLEHWLLVAVVAVTAVALALPDPGRWLDRHSGVDLVLVVLVLASGLGIPSGAAGALRRLAPRLAVLVVITAVTLPLVADGLAHVLGGGPLRDGVLAVGVAPAEVASIGLSGLAGGDVAVAAALLAASTLVSVAAAGPILSLLAGAGVSGSHVVVQLALVVGLPLVVGLLGRPALRALPSTAADDGAVLAATLSLVATVSVLVLVALVAVQVRLETSYLTVTAVLAALIALSAVGGALLGRLLPPPAARSALLHVSMRDFAIASGIAAAAFGSAATGPLGIYGVLVIAWGTVVATWSARRADGALSRR
jgi:predicted Na+-dependent transporter